jgi:hypothetical protein
VPAVEAALARINLCFGLAHYLQILAPHLYLVHRIALWLRGNAVVTAVEAALARFDLGLELALDPEVLAPRTSSGAGGPK